ncbi:hypothetical protein O6H91_15G084900 [Diphasiastrum complanatum]|uniref:Uncharacterized protein n=1 Tax=Diphasiastrum complanatum TaxID=34168 RepID=A0ACC2BKA0_DIPCM|nr:hypothetical protein O6H91_15G084900 [Diphasiastrum complanatum]
MDDIWTAMNLWKRCYRSSDMCSRYSLWVYTSLVVSLLAVSGCCDLLQERSNRMLAARIDEVNGIIRDSALKVLSNGKSCVIYDVTLPLSLSGVTVKAVRIKAKNLTKRGFTFKEFTIPAGTLVNGQSRWIALVYRNFGEFHFYNANKFTIQTPVLGIKVYKYSRSVYSAGEGSELNLIAGSASIKVRIPSSSLRTGRGIHPLCAAFDQTGHITISRLSWPPNVCTTSHSGDFCLVLPPLPAIPASQPSSAQPPKAQRPSPAFTPQRWPPTPATAPASSPFGPPTSQLSPTPVIIPLPPAPTPYRHFSPYPAPFSSFYPAPSSRPSPRRAPPSHPTAFHSSSSPNASRSQPISAPAGASVSSAQAAPAPATTNPISSPLPFTLPSPSSPLSSAPPSSPTAGTFPNTKQEELKSSNAWKIALGSSVGGIASFLFLSILLLFGIRYSNRRRIARMEYTSNWGAPLQTALIGNSRAPIAGGIRTRPSLEIM